MQVVHERCCGLDVHKKTVVACVITPEGKQTRTFGTMTRDLLALGQWLLEQGVTHVAMESTGVYWKPVYNILEGMEFELLVANAQHIKAVPGRKTDVKDCEARERLYSSRGVDSGAVAAWAYPRKPMGAHASRGTRMGPHP